MQETMPEKAKDSGRSGAAAIWKHPLHPAVVDFPVVLLSAALVTDLVFWRSGEALWADFSFWLILAGWLTGLAAIFTGLVDFLSLRQARELPAGWLHFLLADLAIFLSTFNLAGRLSDRQAPIVFTGLGLSASTVILLLVAASLGGQLVFQHRIGIFAPPDETIRGED